MSMHNMTLMVCGETPKLIDTARNHIDHLHVLLALDHRRLTDRNLKDSCK
jgi:hypothetical protein